MKKYVVFVVILVLGAGSEIVVAGRADFMPIPPRESNCTDPTFFRIPTALENQQGYFGPDLEAGCPDDRHCGRVVEVLREAAKTKDAEELLIRSAVDYFLLETDYWPPHFLYPQAYADLAATGWEAYHSLRALGMDKEALIASLVSRVRTRINRLVSSTHPDYDLSGAIITSHLQKAVDRTFAVAWAIRGPVQYRTRHRPALDWIAVSGEDDQPHRPVNVDSAPYPQYNLDVIVPNPGGAPSRLTITTRFIVISEFINDAYPVDTNRLPSHDVFPPVITGDIILYIHGHGSSAEEATTIANEAFTHARSLDRPVTLIGVDLPGYAYASRIRPGSLSESAVTNFPGLRFIEAFIIEFVATLNGHQPGIENQIVGVIGGSLGGNMGLRLARMDSNKYPWLRSVVSWSPASSWLPFFDPFWGCDDVRKCLVIHGAGPFAVGLFDMMSAQEMPDRSRRRFFYWSFKRGVFSTAGKWYRDGWRCKASSLRASEWFLKEIYHKFYRRWHWRIAFEQLQYSHQFQYSIIEVSNVITTIIPYLSTTPRLFLIAGSSDNGGPERLYDNTVRIAEGMPLVNGYDFETLFIADTGHSIHAERPRLLARRALDFLYKSPRPPLPAFLIIAANF